MDWIYWAYMCVIIHYNMVIYFCCTYIFMLYLVVTEVNMYLYIYIYIIFKHSWTVLNLHRNCQNELTVSVKDLLF